MKPRRPIPRANPQALWNVLARSQPTPPEDVTHIMVLIRTAWQVLREGNGEDEHADRLGAALNVGIVRSEEIHPELTEILMRAGKAMAQAQRIEREHGKYGFTGPGLIAISEAIDAYEVILAASSPLQMHRAMLESARRLQRMQVIQPEEHA